MARKVHGICCICGKESDLTFEHIPPRAAFNHFNLKLYDFWGYLTQNKTRYQSLQNGAGRYSLCASCNNRTGEWYGAAFAEFVSQGMQYYKSGATGIVGVPYTFYPLRVLNSFQTRLTEAANGGIMCSYKYICYSTALTEGGLMKQSNNKKSRDVTAFLYERLSRDDNLEGESYSIGNQKKLLAKVAKEKGYTNLVHFLDDGISGVTMDRPGFVDMIRQLEQGKAAAVFVKDLSRLGRNYIEVGRLTEEFFPEHDIRLVAVSDNIDTAEGDNELAPIRNLFNEWYARDISKKRRISNKIKGNAGEPMGQPP